MRKRFLSSFVYSDNLEDVNLVNMITLSVELVA